MSVRNLAPGDRRALAMGAMFAAPLVFWMLVVTPYLHAVQETRSTLEANRDLLVRERRLIAGVKRYPAALDSGKARLAVAAERLFEGDNEPALVSALAAHLRRYARESRVHLAELKSTTADSATSALTAIAMSVSGESDLEGVLTFLHSLEEGTKLVHVDQLEIESSPRADAVGPEVLSFQLVAKGFALDGRRK